MMVVISVSKIRVCQTFLVPEWLPFILFSLSLSLPHSHDGPFPANGTISSTLTNLSWNIINIFLKINLFISPPQPCLSSAFLYFFPSHLLPILKPFSFLMTLSSLHIHAAQQRKPPIEWGPMIWAGSSPNWPRTRATILGGPCPD